MITVPPRVIKPISKMIVSGDNCNGDLSSQWVAAASAMPMVFMKLLVAISWPFSSLPLRCCNNAFKGTAKSPAEKPRSTSASAVAG